MIHYLTLSSKYNFVVIVLNVQLLLTKYLFFIFRKVFILVDYLQKKNIPHNIYITRALNKDLDTNDLGNTRNCVRVFIWARTPSGNYKYFLN